MDFRMIFDQEGNANLQRHGLFRPKLKLAMLVLFRLGLNSARDCDDALENALADFVNSLGTVDYSTRRKIEIVRHTFEHRRV